MTTWWHAERVHAVAELLRADRAARVLDLGCGDGDLFVRLAADPAVTELVGIDVCARSLAALRARLAVTTGAVDIRRGSMTDPDPALAGFDCAVLVETIEHLPPDRLSRLERALFATLRPRGIVVTTPNAEFNPLLGVPRGRFRHPDHRFEWDRARFRRWGRRAARAAGYGVAFRDIAGRHPDLGGASQMAVFRRAGRDDGG